ncbi:MAG: hypothetical protein HY823_03400 [Acidobacteria bacterium]|nr:hypothetical protein [Acidobacteriota bacterium]
MQKRQAQVPSGLRTKTCDKCGRTFELEPEQKFFLCRDCYEESQRRQHPRKARGTSILTLIRCAQCGGEEYLDFLPADPAEALCKACFTKRKREQKARSTHSIA